MAEKKKGSPLDEDYIPLLLEDEHDAGGFVDEPDDEEDIEELTYEQRAIRRRLSEIEIIEEAIAQRRRDWFRRNRTLLTVIAGILAVGLIFLGIKIFNDFHNPMSQLFSASTKNFGSSFSFNLIAEKNGEPSMRYAGTAEFHPNNQSLIIAYDADYVDYKYTNVVYTNGQISYKGNYYNGQWTLSNCTERVQDFFDFYKDYRYGSFDGGSFLRFFGMNSEYSSIELSRFMNLVKDRMSTDSSIAKITTVRDSKGTTYTYKINIEALFDLIVDRGASIFFRSTDYDLFVKKVDVNRDQLAATECTFSFTVSSSGYLNSFNLEMVTPSGPYSFRCVMSDFGNAEPAVPDSFYEAAGIQKKAD